METTWYANYLFYNFQIAHNKPSNPAPHLFT